MGKKNFVAVYTDSGIIVPCGHRHPNVATATACISQAGGYVVAMRKGEFRPLNDAEEAEFQAAMYGRVQPARAWLPEGKIVVNGKANA